MGNTASQQSPVPDVVSKNLSPKAQRRLSQSPYVQHFFEAAAGAGAGMNRRKFSSTSSSIGSNLSSLSSTRTEDNAILPRSSNRSLSTVSETGTMTPSSTTTTVVDATAVGTLSASDHVAPVEFTMQEGRRYIDSPDIQYLLPCDDDESDRLVILHFLLKYALNGNFVAPVRSILQDSESRAQVLDVGCGPGTWVLEMSTDYGNADFYGVDLCTMFPTTIKPSNAYFHHHNFITDGLPYADETFDYIHMRLMLCHLSHTQLLKLLEEMERVLKPMGHIEILDVDYAIQRPGPLSETVFNQYLRDLLRSLNVDMFLSQHLSTLLMTQPSDRGFVDVHQERVAIPLGWGSQTSEIHAQNFEAYVRSLNPKLRQGRMTSSDIQEMMEECKQYQSHLHWYTCHGRKPAANAAPMTHWRVAIDTPPSSISPSPLTTPSSAVMEATTWETINDFVDGYVD
ncbi:S-adenosyl-L-methionine-dependent methyltransferase [Radiomyces spectabilis]|uniref:S-adenosyl-L-methionine-dependent methyltransferase n=1 Tax=Radiomyces spectabilis TaxID=64574 RepID=UPI00221ECF6C|nr:S-adenosyl-L-methionine-dependent methyltransferase [Radiomyces spectabilis]KAI8364714.1 S-adenosyl-L-methionine-dependent methyltransferase [Radiomyces spectabilis]